MSERTQIWYSGGGTQSTAIGVLIASGKLPKPDLAAIANTGRERSTTWAYAEKYTIPMLRAVGVELHRVSKADWATVDLWGGKDGGTLLIPAFTDVTGDVGKFPQYCTNEWKVRVIRRWATEVHGVRAATEWLGISTDEAARRAKSFGSGKWLKEYPLVRLGISRINCHEIIDKAGLPPAPRSACWLCPNADESEWSWMRENAPADFAKAVAAQREISTRDPHAWLHHECKPLDQIDFDPKNEIMFNRCDSGMCFT